MRFRYLAWLLPLLFCCCNKKDSGTTKKYEDFTFSTSYDSVLTYYTYSGNNTHIFTFNVAVLTGDIGDNPITFSVTNLPANVTVTPSSQVVTHLLGGVFTFAFGSVPVGVDTANLIISSTATGTQTHKLIIKVQAPPDYATLLAGTYAGSYDFCQPDSFFNYSSVVSTIPDTPYKIKITNVKNLGTGFIVRANVSNVVTIPLQSYMGYTIWGSGTFSHDNPPNTSLYQMAINDTLVHGTDTNYCTIHIAHPH
jgi:hypothetical protein